MDKFVVLLEGRVVATYTSADAARTYIVNELIDKKAGALTYEVAQVIATNKAVRVWNEPY